MPDEQRLYITYKVDEHPNGIPSSTVPDEWGACDAMVILAAVYPPDGSLMVNVETLDGRTGGVVEDLELFKLWAMLASRLAASKSLSPRHREFAEHVHSTVRAFVISGRAAGDAKDIPT